MKILMTTMKMDIGGAETHILEAARGLQAAGCEVVVASAGGVFERELAASGIRHVYCPLHTKNPFAVLASIRILNRLLSAERFDIIHAHARIPAFLCAPLAKKHKVRFVTTAHLTFAVNALWRRIASWGERTVAVSDDIKSYLMKEYGVCADTVSVTVNGINTDVYAPDTDGSEVLRELALSAEKRRIVCVSRMDKDRSAAAILLASVAGELHRRFPDTEVLCVGGGDDFERLKTAADEANLTAGETVVRLTGARTDINRLIAVGDIFVGVSRAALEAMAMAKPTVLAGNEGYLGIFTKDKFETAYHTNFCCRDSAPTTAAALLADLTALLSMTAEERAALGADGREIVKRHYSVARMTEDYLAMYRAVRPYAPYRYGDILICGYYGFDNMGDDSLLRAIVDDLHAVSPDCRITVMTKNPKKTRLAYGTAVVNRFHPLAVLSAMKHGKLFIFGGGNLLQDGSSRRSMLYYTTVLRTAKRMGMRVMVYANGIGPLHTEKSRRDAADALSVADRITLREKDSLALCKALVPAGAVRLTADPAFTLKEADEGWVLHRLSAFSMADDRNYFVVALREWKENRAENLKAVARACELLHEKYGWIPVFLPMHELLDGEINRAAQALCGCETRYLSGMTGSEMLGILRRMECVLAMRLHTLIYSTAVGTPSMGLAYDGKLRAFMETMALPYMLDTPDTAAIVAMASALSEKKEEIRAALNEKRAALYETSMQDAREAIAFLK